MGILHETQHVTSNITRFRSIFANSYFVGEGDCWVLVDTGLKGYAKHLITAADKRFGKNSRPKAILLTHAHFDHVGGIHELIKYWDVPVFVHPLEMPHITGKADYPPANPQASSGFMARLSFLYPKAPINLGSRATPLSEDGTIPFLEDWQWIHTPGHTEGHVAFFRERDRFLIAGDSFVTTKQESLLSVLFQKKIVSNPPAYFTPDWASAKASVMKLVLLKPEAALTGHGKPMFGQELRTGLSRLMPEMEKHSSMQTKTGTQEKSVEAEEAESLLQRRDRGNSVDGMLSPGTAAVPLGTDQEAGGAISTPQGRGEYSSGNKAYYANLN